jgi:hypothetical protein
MIPRTVIRGGIGGAGSLAEHGETPCHSLRQRYLCCAGDVLPPRLSSDILLGALGATGAPLVALAI